MLELDYMKRHLNIEDNRHDNVLVDLEASAVADFEGLSGRYYGSPQAVFEVWSGTPTRHFWLSEIPIPDTLVMSYRVTGSLEWTVLPVASWECFGRRVTFYPGLFTTDAFMSNSNVGDGWPEGVNTVRADYQRGYDGEAGIPGQVVSGVMALVAAKFQQRVTATPAAGNPMFGGDDGKSGMPSSSLPTLTKAAIESVRRSCLMGHNPSILTVVGPVP